MQELGVEDREYVDERVLLNVEVTVVVLEGDWDGEPDVVVDRLPLTDVEGVVVWLLDTLGVVV